MPWSACSTRVLLAFVVISVWEDFHTTEAAVRNEAKAAVDLHRLTFALPVEGGAEIRQRLLSYTDHVRKFEWPSMALGQSSDDVARDLDQLSQAIFDVQPQGERELALYQDAIRLLTVITDNRNERLDSSDGSVPPVLWFVLIIGGADHPRLSGLFRVVESVGANPHDRHARRARFLLACCSVLPSTTPSAAQCTSPSHLSTRRWSRCRRTGRLLNQRSLPLF